MNIVSISKQVAALFSLMIFLLGSTPIFAGELPNTIRYDGSLYGAKGGKVKGETLMQFYLFDVETGAAPIWEETQTVNIVDNKFTVELGASTALNFNTLDRVLYISHTLFGEPVAMARERLPMQPYAARAMDANTVGGMDPGSLDQSAHVADQSNPHGVTAHQAGLLSGPTVYMTTNSSCVEGSNHITFQPECRTRSCTIGWGGTGQYDCNGVCISGTIPKYCQNQKMGALLVVE